MSVSADLPPGWEILEGDALALLRGLPDDHVQTVVTSPPYFGLRDYGVEGQIGLEESPEAFIDRLVEVFTEVRRVMRPDATAWINMGDSFSNDGGTPTQGKNGIGRGRGASAAREAAGRRPLLGRKPKDLIGQPWMLAFALRDRVGLYLRQEIIWHKRSVMPESCRDRPTRAHEQPTRRARAPRAGAAAETLTIQDVGAARARGGHVVPRAGKPKTASRRLMPASLAFPKAVRG